MSVPVPRPAPVTAPPPSMPAGSCVPRWLEPLRSALPELTGTDWVGLGEFEAALREVLVPPSPAPTGQSGRGAALLAARRRLAPLTARHGAALGPDRVRADLVQTARQVVCGFYDLDQRDASGPGHGQMILRHGSPECRDRWAPRLHAGELAGIAMTEAVGGTRVHAITTALATGAAGGWHLTGEKRWISRLHEAAVFVVFARTPDGPIAAAAVDAAAPGITRHPEEPTGLSGWSWGRLLLDAVPVAADAVFSRPGYDGLAVFAEHFAHYRPLVTATALGAAAAVHDAVTAHLAGREQRGEITRVRDHALIAVGRTHAQINGGLLAVLHAQRLAATAHPAASLWGRGTKAVGVDLARAAADELSVLVGAAGFTADHHLQKARRDLDALRYADGMHDSLHRSAGRTLLNASATTTPAPNPEGPTHDLDPAAPAAPVEGHGADRAQR